MKPWPLAGRLLAALLLLAIMTPIALFGMMGVQYTASPLVVVIENRSSAPLALTVATSYDPSPIWQGRLNAGGKAQAATRIRGEGELTVRCRPVDGPERIHGLGYLTIGFDERVSLTVRSCDDIDDVWRELML